MSDTAATANLESADASSYSFSSLQQWQVAFIYAFSATFNPHQEVSPQYYKLPSFTPQDLEDEIQKQESELIHQIICACIGNILNRNKPVESFKNSLQQLITDKMKTFDIDLESNPLLKQNYNALPIDIKLYILYSLVEWQLQDSSAVKLIVDTYNLQDGLTAANPIIARSVGTDSKKRTYWQFGDSPWIWRETNSTKSLSQWETLCRNRQDLEQLVDSFSGTTSRLEKALIKTITEEIYDIADKEEQKKLRKERAEMRKLIPVEVSITPTTLRSRGNRSQRVHYNFDDIYGIDEDEYNETNDDDDFVDEDENRAAPDTPRRQRSKRQASPPRPPPTRWSSRLSRGAAPTTTGDNHEKTSVEFMEVDAQSVETMDTTLLPSKQSNGMDTSRSPSLMDTAPSQSPMQAVSNVHGVMSVNDILNPQGVHD